MSMYAKVRRLILHCDQPRGWNPPGHALVNSERAGLVNIGRASTRLGNPGARDRPLESALSSQPQTRLRPKVMLALRRGRQSR